MRTSLVSSLKNNPSLIVGMKPLSERDENHPVTGSIWSEKALVGMKPLSERDEN